MKIPAAALRQLFPKNSKYGNKISYCLLKHRHDSRAEADYCNSLLVDLKADKIRCFNVQVSVDVGPGIVHVVDFAVSTTNNKNWPYFDEVHDVKGFQTAVWRMKYKLFVAKYPHIKYVIVNRKEDNGASR